MIKPSIFPIKFLNKPKVWVPVLLLLTKIDKLLILWPLPLIMPVKSFGTQFPYALKSKSALMLVYLPDWILTKSLGVLMFWTESEVTK